MGDKERSDEVPRSGKGKRKKEKGERRGEKGDEEKWRWGGNEISANDPMTTGSYLILSFLLSELRNEDFL